MPAETYEIYSENFSIRPEQRFEGSNAARFAILASLIGQREDPDTGSQSSLSTDVLQRFGFNPDVREFSENSTAENENDIRGAETIMSEYGEAWNHEEVRLRAWSAFNERIDGTHRLALLTAGLGSPLERESATAATAILSSTLPQAVDDSTRNLPRLSPPFARWEAVPPDASAEPTTSWDWNGQSWERYSRFYVRWLIRRGDPERLVAGLRMLSAYRTDVGRRSTDPIVRELSMASRMGISRMGGQAETLNPSGLLDPALILRDKTTSTMVHGTWGWKGDWWYTGGDFHNFILGDHRPNLYSGGKEFSWSGAYSNTQRYLSGERLKRWIDSEGGLTTVFGHSFGGEIIARAVNKGAQIAEVVLLSAPVNHHHVSMLQRVHHVYDVRLKFDIVLTAARARQNLPSAHNVTEFGLDLPLWSHSATHDPDLWKKHNIASIIGL